MVVLDVGILWVFLSSALVVLMQAQAIRLAKTNRELASSEAALRLRNAELDSANARLSEIDSLKNRFLAGVAQELRRPLTSLLSEAKLLLRHDYQGAEVVDRVSSAIVGEAEHLARLIDNLPERGDVDWQVIDASESKVDPALVLRAAVSTVASVAKCQNVEIRCNATAGLSEVWANHERLVHALVLLLDSAITYTPSGEYVVAEVESAGPEIVFRIAQPSGKGFSDSKVRHISDIARTAAKSKGKDIAGGGFALSLCQEIVENHRGRFWVDDEGATAATFHVALPAIAYEPRTATYSGQRNAAATGQ